MEKTLGLSAIALCFSAFVSMIALRSMDALKPTWPLIPRLLLVSAAPPAVFLVFQAALFAIIGDLGHVLGKAHQRDDVFVGPALALWLCGALLAVLIGLLRLRAGPPAAPSSNPGAGPLMGVFVTCCAGLVLGIGMQSWIETGSMGPIFILIAIVSALAIGLVPVVSLAVGLFSRVGIRGLYWARRAAITFGALICIAAFGWYKAVAWQPGAWTILPVSASAVFGAFVGWGLIGRWIQPRQN